ncbi:MAG: hypothetical protein NC416_08900 [Eubacterium sp.]|nr:hypothetical protein [Eubacterium sp.]
MWMRLLVCTKDVTYAKRLSALFEREYGEKMEISVFSDPQYLMESEKCRTADVVLFGGEFEQEAVTVSRNMSWVWAVLSELLYGNEEEAVVRFPKYQRADDLYKAILDLYAKGGRVRRSASLNKDGKGCRVYTFLSAGGGVGTTSVARAYAGKCALYEKVLYLDMRMSEIGWNHEETEHGMDEILVALKSRRDILPIKLMSAVTVTRQKVSVYAPCKEPIHLLEVTGEDAARLIHTVRGLGEYDKVVLDAGNNFSERELSMIRQADSLVYVAEDTETARQKYEKLCSILQSLEQREGNQILRKMMLFRNKAVRKEQIGWEIRECGWAPKIEGDSFEAVIDRIMQSDAFDNMEGNDGE